MHASNSIWFKCEFCAESGLQCRYSRVKCTLLNLKVIFNSDSFRPFLRHLPRHVKQSHRCHHYHCRRPLPHPHQFLRRYHFYLNIEITY